MTIKKSKLKEKKFYINGMHCASCKSIIEDRLMDRGDIANVVVDLKSGTADVAFYKKGIPADVLTEKFADVGYVFSYEPIKNNARKRIFFAISAAIIISIILAQSEKFLLWSNVSVDENSSLVAFVILGVVASLSSCVALVGGILLSMTKSWTKSMGDDVTLSQKMESHVKFHIGRLIAYFVGGGILGVVGNFITFNNPTFYAILTIVIAITMFFIGLQMLEVKWALRLYVSIYEHTFKNIRIKSSVKNKSPFIAGAATFFIPCGFTLIAQGIALTTGSFIIGAIIMSAFAIGTLPVLIGVSLGGATMIGKKGFEVIFNTVIGTIIIVFAIYILNGQLNVLGMPSFSDINLSGANNQNQSEDMNDILEDEQELHIVADGFEYIVVGSNVLQAGIPTTMIVDNQGIAGCGVFMAARGLFDGAVELNPGINEKKFIPKAGTYKLTCTMGMVAPMTIIVK